MEHAKQQKRNEQNDNERNQYVQKPHNQPLLFEAASGIGEYTGKQITLQISPKAL